MTLALRIFADVFVFVILAGVGGFFVLVGLARIGEWRRRRQDVRWVRAYCPPPFDPDDHDDLVPHANQGCQQCADDDLVALREARAKLDLRAAEASWTLPTYNKESSR